MQDSSSRPLLAITMGDITGIGPEIIVKSLTGADIYQGCRPLVLGDLTALEMAKAICGPHLEINVVVHPAAGKYQPGTIDLLALSRVDRANLIYGRPTPGTGAQMVGYILRAIDLALAGEVAGVVTAPISKTAMHLGGYNFPGHTELLAERTGTREFAMMLAGDNFRVVLATIHCALREVPERLRTDDLFRLIALTHSSLQSDFGLDHPRVGVAALNPHGSEGGLFGREEAEIIVPAVQQAQDAGLNVTGPLPADTIFVKHHKGEFDAVVVMYHDQGLIPLKLLHFGNAVNVTLGLPIIRTSVDHGTAYDLAGTGQADPGSLKAAIRMATAMAQARKAIHNNKLESKR